MKIQPLFEGLKREPLLFHALGVFLIGSALLAGLVYAYPGGFAHDLRILLAVAWVVYAATLGTPLFSALVVFSQIPNLVLLFVACVPQGAWQPLVVELFSR